MLLASPNSYSVISYFVVLAFMQTRTSSGLLWQPRRRQASLGHLRRAGQLGWSTLHLPEHMVPGRSTCRCPVWSCICTLLAHCLSASLACMH